MWDPIMQVGKTPQVTQDVISNPLEAGQEITGSLYLYLDAVGTATSATGTVLSLTDVFFDYVAGDAVTLVNSLGAGSSTESRIIADNGKYINIRGITLYLQYTRAGTNYPDCNIIIETSTDGVNYTAQTSSSLSTGTRVNMTLTTQTCVARYIRLRFAWSGNSSTPTTLYLKKFRVWTDALQRFY